MDKSNKNFVYILTGTSGAGKGTIFNLIIDDPALNLNRIVRYTTRTKRNSEVEGTSYHFVDDKTFYEMVQRDEFISSEEFPAGWYGTSKQSIVDSYNSGQNLLIDLDVVAATRLIEFLKTNGMNYIDMFVAPCTRADLKSETGIKNTLKVIERRMINRNDGKPLAKKDMDVRLKNAYKWLKNAQQFNYIIENPDGQIGSAVEQVKSLIN